VPDQEPSGHEVQFDELHPATPSPAPQAFIRKRMRALRGGRPEVGPAFSLRFPPDLLGKVDEAAAAEGVTRAAWIRAATQTRIAATSGPAPFHDKKGSTMNDQTLPEPAEQPAEELAPDHLPWPEDNSKPQPDGSVMIKVRRWDLSKRP